MLKRFQVKDRSVTTMFDAPNSEAWRALRKDRANIKG